VITAPEVIWLTRNNVPKAKTLAISARGTRRSDHIKLSLPGRLILHADDVGKTAHLRRCKRTIAAPRRWAARNRILPPSTTDRMRLPKGLLPEDEKQQLLIRSAVGGLVSMRSCRRPASPYELTRPFTMRYLTFKAKTTITTTRFYTVRRPSSCRWSGIPASLYFTRCVRPNDHAQSNTAR